MREPQAKTKVVIRRLPPNLKEDVVVEAINRHFVSRYNWFYFQAGGTRSNTFSRAYINFKKPEDVFDFSDTFQGHVFVNERGVPFRASVEYAPFQRIPKQRARKDPKEGTIFKDEEYLQFVASLEKPVESLPSAEVQLERKEAEKAAAVGAAKEAVVVTPLMDYVRQKRASKLAPSTREQKVPSVLAKQVLQGGRGGGAPAPSAILAPPGGAQQRRTQPDKARTEADKVQAGNDALPAPSQQVPLPSPPGKDDSREGAIERRRKEVADSQAQARDRKVPREGMAPAVGSAKASKEGRAGGTGPGRATLGAVPGSAPAGSTPAATAGSSAGSAAAARAAAAAALAGASGASSPRAESGKGREAGQARREAAKLRSGEAGPQASGPSKPAQASKTQREREEGPSGESAAARGGLRREGLPRKQRLAHAGKGKEQSEAVDEARPGRAAGQVPSKEEQQQETGATETGFLAPPSRGDAPSSPAYRGGRDGHAGVGGQHARQPLHAATQAVPPTRQQLQQQQDEGAAFVRGLAAGDAQVRAGTEAGAQGSRESSAGGAGADVRQAMQVGRSGAVPEGSAAAAEAMPSAEQGPQVPGTPLSDRGEPRRLRNKDRPDRPVWTPRRRGDAGTEVDATKGATGSAPSGPPRSSVAPEAGPAAAGGQGVGAPAASTDRSAGQAGPGAASVSQPARAQPQQQRRGGRGLQAVQESTESTALRPEGVRGPGRRAAALIRGDVAPLGAIQAGMARGQGGGTLGSSDEPEVDYPTAHTASPRGRSGGGRGPRGPLRGSIRASPSHQDTDSGARAEVGGTSSAVAGEPGSRGDTPAGQPPGKVGLLSDGKPMEPPRGGSVHDRDRRGGQRPARPERTIQLGPEGGPGSGDSRQGRRAPPSPRVPEEKQMWVPVQRSGPSS